MTKIYFVRHAQPDYTRDEDRTRSLTLEGQKDAKSVLEFFKDKIIDKFYSSPYKRSKDTIKETAEYFDKEITTDNRLREREKGKDGNVHGMFQKRWANHDYHEDGGESINMVQRRNIAALEEIIKGNDGKTIVIGTHGTALSSIMHYYNPEFGCDDFLRIIDWMPYIVELQFEDTKLVSTIEHLHIYKKFEGINRADK